MPEMQIVINVHGGLVQEVFASAPLAELVVVDWDVAPGDHQSVEVEVGRRHLQASVQHPNSRSTLRVDLVWKVHDSESRATIHGQGASGRHRQEWHVFRQSELDQFPTGFHLPSHILTKREPCYQYCHGLKAKPLQ